MKEREAQLTGRSTMRPGEQHCCPVLTIAKRAINTGVECGEHVVGKKWRMVR